MVSGGLADGMLWGSLILIGVPLAIGIGVAIVVLRHRRKLGSSSNGNPVNGANTESCP